MIVACPLNQIDANDLITLLPVIVLFVGIFVISSMIFCFITFTNKFNENIVEVGHAALQTKNRLSDDSRTFFFGQNLILKNNTKSMEWWQKSPIQPLLKIHIFNYTNIDDFLSGRDKKIKLQDVGPYVYKEFGQRVNLAFSDDNKITFNVSCGRCDVKKTHEIYSTGQH